MLKAFDKLKSNWLRWAASYSANRPRRDVVDEFDNLVKHKSVVSSNGQVVGIRSEEDLLIVESETGKRIKSILI